MAQQSSTCFEPGLIPGTHDLTSSSLWRSGEGDLGPLYLPGPVSHDQGLRGEVPRGRFQPAHLCAGKRAAGGPLRARGYAPSGQALTCPLPAPTGAAEPCDGPSGWRLGHAGALPGQARPLPLLLLRSGLCDCGVGSPSPAYTPPTRRQSAFSPTAHRPSAQRASTFSSQRGSPIHSPRAASPVPGSDRRGSRPEVTPMSSRSSKEGPETPLR